MKLRGRIIETPEIESVNPLGGGVWAVTFKPTELEKIFDLGGEVCFVQAKDEKEAVDKARRKYIRRLCV